MTEWFALDETKADYGAVFGAYVAGCTLLELPGGTCVAVGLCSCATRDGAEQAAIRNPGPADKDRRVSKATLESWRKA